MPPLPFQLRPPYTRGIMEGVEIWQKCETTWVHVPVTLPSALTMVTAFLTATRPRCSQDTAVSADKELSHTRSVCEQELTPLSPRNLLPPRPLHTVAGMLELACDAYKCSHQFPTRWY